MEEKTQLFCIPYAGGSAAIFNKWKSILQKEIDLVPIELSGRGRRIGEKLYSDFTEAVEDIYHSIKCELQGGSFSIFGHSMGGWLALEVSKQFHKKEEPLPDHLFISAICPPYESKKEKKLHLLNKTQFKQEIAMMGGTDKAIIQNDEAFDFFLPIIHSDYKILENYVPDQETIAVDCSATIFRGTKDLYSLNQMEAWERHIKKACEQVLIEGGHFFLFDQQRMLIEIINRTMKTIEGGK